MRFCPFLSGKVHLKQLCVISADSARQVGVTSSFAFCVEPSFYYSSEQVPIDTFLHRHAIKGAR
jgi:hypothetical protein